ncbi:MAG: hypothetical protein D6706_05370 [Chloroflexi bacterium]|nr:MAG: hypothetical protein D6706_05370 [Chloroflexota bacterium]
MILPRTQLAEYWENEFALNESDIEQIYNHFLEVERPQTTADIAHMLISHRVAEERHEIERQLAGRAVYQPKKQYKVGDELVFPALKFAHGKITDTREGYNPDYGKFTVIIVKFNGKTREFAAGLDIPHPLNQNDQQLLLEQLTTVNVEDLVQKYSEIISQKIEAALEPHPDFVRLGNQWFVKSLMAEVNIGHLHLAEAVLDVSGGGPLPPEEILPHLDMDPSLDKSVQIFSLNYALLQDDRFDEVAPRGQVGWFLKRMEPKEIHEPPARLQYTPIPYDRALLSPQLLQLERELDDEWSDLEPPGIPEPVTFCLIYPHRWAGTMPFSSRIRALVPPSRSPRQRIVLVDEATGNEIVGWVVREHRFIYGLKEWYAEHEIPIGGYIHLKPGPEPGVLLLNYDRRRAQREWVRLATAENDRIKFELSRRAIACGYDDLLIVGTDTVAAIDALWRRAESRKRSVPSLLAEIFPELARLTPQNTVHAKTLYSAINMLRRIPPAPLFAELVRHPAFQPVGDHYWQFDSKRWQSSS